MQSSSFPRLVVPRSLLRPSWPVLLLGLLLLAFALPLSAAPAAWGLDPTFGNGGVVMPDVLSRGGYVRVAIQADGKLVVAGSSTSDNRVNDLLVMRYYPDGRLDESFGSGGKVIYDITGPNDSPADVALQADGKIVVAMSNYATPTERPDTDFVLIRLNNDGGLDTSFDGDGKVTTDFGPYTGLDTPEALAVQSDGKILAVGSTWRWNVSPPDISIAIARYNSDGSPDADFGTNGEVTTRLTAEANAANSVVFQEDGKFVIGGYIGDAIATSDTDFLLVRYNSSGTLDETFGDGGAVRQDFAQADDNVVAVLIQEDGKLVAVGTAELGDCCSFRPPGVALARFEVNGELDSAFGENGKVTDMPKGLPSVHVTGAQLQSDGGVLLGGFAYDPSQNDSVEADVWWLQRYSASGVLDQQFGSLGTLVTDVVEEKSEYIHDMALQADGKLVVVGTIYRDPSLETPPSAMVMGRYSPDAPRPIYNNHVWIPFVRHE